MTDTNTTNGVSDLLEMGAAHADVGERITAVDHPDDDGVAVLVSREHTEDGADRIVLANDVMDALDARMPGPRARKGVHVFTEIESLIAYTGLYKGDSSIAYAQLDQFRVEIVFDDHPAGPDRTMAAWRTHRAVYTCPRSPEWQAWCAFDGKAMSQEQFGDFIEQRLEDLRGDGDMPKPLEMLQIARHLVVHQKGAFERKIDPTTGNGILINKVENDVGSTVIPRAFMLGIPVFEGGQAYRVEARVRFAISDGRPTFTYVLHRRKEIERDAFMDVRKRLSEATALLVLAGQP